MTLQTNATTTVNFVDLKILLSGQTTPTVYTLTIVTQGAPPPTPKPSDAAAEAPSPLPATEDAIHSTALPEGLDLTRPPRHESEEVRIKVVALTTASSSNYGTGGGTTTGAGAGAGAGAGGHGGTYGSGASSHTVGATPPRLLGAMGNNTHRMALSLPLLSDTAIAAITELDRLFLVEAELTQRGYDRRIQDVLAPFTPVAADGPTISHAASTTAPAESANMGANDAEDGAATGAAVDADEGLAGNAHAAGARALLAWDDGPLHAASHAQWAVVASSDASPNTAAATSARRVADIDADGVTAAWSEYRTNLVRTRPMDDAARGRARAVGWTPFC